MRWDSLNKATGSTSSGQTVTTDPDVTSLSTLRQAKWVETVKITHAREKGWSYEDLELTVDADSLRDARIERGIISPSTGNPTAAGLMPQSRLTEDGRVEVRFRYRNKTTGESGFAGLTTLDKDSISDFQADFEKFVERVRVTHAHKEGWRVEETEIAVDQDMLAEAKEEIVRRGGTSFAQAHAELKLRVVNRHKQVRRHK